MPSGNWYYPSVGLWENWSVNSDGIESAHSQGVALSGYLAISRLSSSTPNFRRYYLGSGKKGVEPLKPQVYVYEKRAHKTDPGADDYELFDKHGSLLAGYYGHGIRGGTYNSDDVYLPGQDVIDSVVARATSNVLLEMKDQKVNIAQAAGERKQTVDLFANTARRVVDTVVLLRRGDWNRAAKGLGLGPSARKHRKLIRDLDKDPARAVANAWIELQYGWKPLLQDVYGSAELIAQKRVRETRTKVQKGSSTSGEHTLYAFDSALSSTRVSGKWKVSCKIGHTFAVPNEEYHTLTQLGITNPALVAWELTPWSFVVDWFIPIGNWISSWDATNGLVFESGYRTTALEWTSVGQESGGQSEPDPWGNVTKTTKRLSASTKFFRVTREPLGGFPSVRPPSFKNPFSVTHVLNAVALLIQTFKR